MRSWPKSADAAEALWKELFDDRYPDEILEGDEDEELTPTPPRKPKASAKKDSRD